MTIPISLQIFNKLSAVPSGLAADIYCTTWLSPDLFLSLAVSSGFNLLFLSIERYLAITRPISYNEQRIKSKLPLLIPAIWISGFVFTLPDPLFFQVKDGLCVYTAATWPKRDMLLSFGYYALTGFIIPGVAMLAMYTHMAIVIWRSQELQRQMTSKSGNTGILGKAQINIFYTCVMLVFLFLTCWIWNEINTMLYLMEVIPFSFVMFHASSMLIVFNSLVNPFIYTIRYDEFQEHLKLLLFGKQIKTVSTVDVTINTVA